MSGKKKTRKKLCVFDSFSKKTKMGYFSTKKRHERWSFLEKYLSSKKPNGVVKYTKGVRTHLFCSKQFQNSSPAFLKWKNAAWRMLEVAGVAG